MIARLGGEGVARGWSRKEDKNTYQIYNHFLTFNKCTNRVTKCRFTLLRPTHPPSLFIYFHMRHSVCSFLVPTFSFALIHFLRFCKILVRKCTYLYKNNKCSQMGKLMWATPLDFKRCGICDRQRLRPACAYAQTDQGLCLSLKYSTTVKLLTEHHLEFLSLKWGCTGSSESTLVKMPHCWRSHVMAHVMLLLLLNHARIQNVLSEEV